MNEAHYIIIILGAIPACFALFAVGEVIAWAVDKIWG